MIEDGRRGHRTILQRSAGIPPRPGRGRSVFRVRVDPQGAPPPSHFKKNNQTTSPKRYAIEKNGNASRRVKLIGSVALVAIVGVVVLGGRSQLAKVQPREEKPTLVDLGISVKFAVSRRKENDQPVVAVDGQVTNIDKVTRDVPKLHVALHDSSDHELQSVDVVMTDQRLLPGGSAPFHAMIANPAQAATNVVVSFARP